MVHRQSFLQYFIETFYCNCTLEQFFYDAHKTFIATLHRDNLLNVFIIIIYCNNPMKKFMEMFHCDPILSFYAIIVFCDSLQLFFNFILNRNYLLHHHETVFYSKSLLQ